MSPSPLATLGTIAFCLAGGLGLIVGMLLVLRLFEHRHSESKRTRAGDAYDSSHLSFLDSGKSERSDRPVDPKAGSR